MSNLLHVPHKLDPATHSCRAIIETPKGRQCKFDYDGATGLFEMAGMLLTGMNFPLAFGFIPSTLGEDGDPLDILVLAEEELPIGCLLWVRLIGIIEAQQTEGGQTVRNDRIIARAAHSRLFADVHEVAELGQAFTDELATFFVAYNALKGKSFDVIATGDAARALAKIQEAIQ